MLRAGATRAHTVFRKFERCCAGNELCISAPCTLLFCCKPEIERTKSDSRKTSASGNRPTTFIGSSDEPNRRQWTVLSARLKLSSETLILEL